MYKHILHIIGWIVIFSGFSGNITSQTLTDSHTLKRMLQDADKRGISIDGKEELDLSALANPGKILYVRYDNRQIITDMGVCLFPKEAKLPSVTPVVYDFVERYLLRLLLKPTKEEQISLLQEDFCRLSVDGKEFKQSHFSMSEIIRAIQMDSPLLIQKDSLQFAFHWNQMAGNHLPTISFVFPKQYDLICGKDKKEILHHLCEELKAFKPGAVSDSTALLPKDTQKGKNIYSFMEEIYLIPQVKSGVHFFFKDSGFSYLFNERFAEESLLNLFGHADQMNFANPLELEIKGYQFSQLFPYTLRELTAFMRDRHFQVYVGIEEWNEKEYVGTAFYINWDLMCKHLLYFHFPRSAFKQKQVAVKAVLHPFIPIQNIGTLYDSDTKTEGKNILVK